MATSNADPGRSSEKQIADSNTSTLLRLGWMLAGNAFLAVLAVVIFMAPAWTLSIKDALFWTVVAAIIVARFVDVVHFRGLTAYGEPATRQHVVRHAIGLLGASAALWVVAQSVQIVGA